MGEGREGGKKEEKECAHTHARAREWEGVQSEREKERVRRERASERAIERVRGGASESDREREKRERETEISCWLMEPWAGITGIPWLLLTIQEPAHQRAGIIGGCSSCSSILHLRAVPIRDEELMGLRYTGGGWSCSHGEGGSQGTCGMRIIISYCNCFYPS